jgi:hypothetical protein
VEIEISERMKSKGSKFSSEEFTNGAERLKLLRKNQLLMNYRTQRQVCDGCPTESDNGKNRLWQDDHRRPQQSK